MRGSGGSRGLGGCRGGGGDVLRANVSAGAVSDHGPVPRRLLCPVVVLLLRVLLVIHHRRAVGTDARLHLRLCVPRVVAVLRLDVCVLRLPLDCRRVNHTNLRRAHGGRCGAYGRGAPRAKGRRTHGSSLWGCTHGSCLWPRYSNLRTHEAAGCFLRASRQLPPRLSRARRIAAAAVHCSVHAVCTQCARSVHAVCMQLVEGRGAQTREAAVTRGSRARGGS